MNNFLIKTSILSLIVFGFQSISYAQSKDLRESLYLQTNKTFLVSGEELLFSAYLTSDKTQKLIDFSKILYVELIGNNKTVVDQQKINLNSGLGSGSIFIGSDIGTGKYFLVAYTRWMKNFGDYFKIPITIVNPFIKSELEKQAGSSPIDFDIFTDNRDNSIVSEVFNRLVIKINNTNTNGFEGAIYDQEGKEISKFLFDKNLATTDLIPKTNNSYKAIITDKFGKKHFIPLNISSRSISKLIVEKIDGNFVLNASSNNDSHQKSVFNLKITNAQSVLSTKKLIQGYPLIISEKELPKGLLFFDLVYDSTSIDKTWLINNHSIISKFDSARITAGKREDVLINENIPNGNYTISVNKVYNQTEGININSSYRDLIFNVKQIDILDLDNSIEETRHIYDIDMDSNQFKNISFLPEVRNEILKGSIAKDEQPLNKPLFLSFPGASYQLYTSKTDKNGDFRFHFISPSSKRLAYIGVLSDSINLNYQIEQKFIGDTFDFTFDNITINNKQIEEIKNRSINVQIEDAFNRNYSEIESPLSNTYYKPILNYDYHYALSNYKKFNSIKEHLTEYVYGVSVSNNKISISPIKSTPQITDVPLILLDGLPIPSNQILNINPLLIDSISTLRELVFMNNSVFNGVVHFSTVDGDLARITPKNAQEINIHAMELEQNDVLSISKKKHKNRIPIRSDQLYWDPNHEVLNNYLKFKFSTGDLNGLYKIEINGFTENGEPVFYKKYLSVI